MTRFLKSVAVAVASAGLVLSCAGAAGAQIKTYNVGHAPAPEGVHTDASGVSGWAVVDAGGGLARKLNAKSVVHEEEIGSYVVNFNSNIRFCAYTGNVTLSGADGVPLPGYVTLVSANGNLKGVFVQTYDASGALSDQLGFTVIVTC